MEDFHRREVVVEQTQRLPPPRGLMASVRHRTRSTFIQPGSFTPPLAKAEDRSSFSCPAFAPPDARAIVQSPRGMDLTTRHGV